MSELHLVERISAVKDAAPRGVKDLANVATRTYGVATARWRPYPDFLIVGTKRGGTTSLWNHLVRHPQVLGMFPRPRGLKSNAYYFEHRERGERWYRSHFHTDGYRRHRSRRVGPVVTGEASPYYMYGPHIPAQIAAASPATRIIVLLRDPVERAHSHHGERVKQGVEPLGFAEALAAEPDRLGAELERVHRDPDHYSRAHDWFSYRDRGIYLPQMQRLFVAFPREQVLVLRAEDLYADTQRVFDEVCRFLGIAPRPIVGPAERNAAPRQRVDAEVSARLRRDYAPHNAELEEFLGRDLGWAS